MTNVNRTDTTGVEEQRDDRTHVLVVDDVEDNRDILIRRLRDFAVITHTAENGRQAIRLLEEVNADLVLLDIMMPEMDGFEVLAAMRANDVWKEIPVIVISALDDMDAIVRCIEMGAADFLTKPFDRVLLRARVSACLEKKRLQDARQSLLREVRLEKERNDAILYNTIPAAIVDRLKAGETIIADDYEEATILFADIVNFSELCGGLPPKDLVAFLGDLFSAFDDLASEHGVEKIKTIGDAYMAVSGVAQRHDDHATAAARMALAMIPKAAELCPSTVDQLSIRVGLHSGPVIAGIVGKQKLVFDVWGGTVNVAKVLEDTGIPSTVHVSSRVKELLGAQFEFEARGDYYVAGVGSVETYLLLGSSMKVGG